MDYSIGIADDRKYILLTVIGDFTALDMMKCIIESHTLGRKENIHCYLVDARHARNIDSAMGNYKFAYTDMKTTEGIDRLARVASLVSPGDHSHDFVETVSNNAGMDLKVFTDIDKAKDYLHKWQPPSSPHK